MADLSAYINFTAVIDNSGSTPVILLTDTGTYPTGVPALVRGVFSVVQPDNLIVAGNFTTPDISAGGGSCSKAYRLDNLGNIQAGLHVITYKVRATGYDETTLVKTIDLSYTKPTLDIVPMIDAFTPSLKVADETIYSQTGLTVGTIVRTWSAVIKKAISASPTVNGTDNALFDMAYASNYYDATYDVYFKSVATLSVNAWLSIKDKFGSTTEVYMSLDIYTPPTLATLLADLTAMKEAADAAGNCGCDNRYTTAADLYTYIVERGQLGQTIGLDQEVLRLRRLLTDSGNPVFTHTNAIIPAYVWVSSGGSGTSNVVVLQPGASTWQAVTGQLVEKVVAIAPTATNIKVGTALNTDNIYELFAADGVGIAAGDKYFASTQTVYFTGVLPDTIIKIYVR